MLKGIFFAISACFIWGFIFLIPHIIENFNSLEVAFGRYFFYGITSFFLLSKSLFKKTKYSSDIWKKAFLFSLITAVGYYPFLVLSLRYCNPAICALILGISPITIAFYGSWKQNEKNFSYLILPSILILIGLVIINAPEILIHDFPLSFFLGIISSLVSLLTWTWFAVANAQFLKNHPELPSGEWSSLMGITTLFWVVLFSGLFLIFLPDVKIEKYTTMNYSLAVFLIGCAFLGCICSWVGAYLWNRASFHLPVSLAGQLMIFETIFGLLFFYIYEQTIPPFYELVGIFILLAAIYHGVKKSSEIHTELVHTS